MNDWQQRVVDEKAALDDKINKLETFSQGPIYSALPEAEQTRLEHQVEYMQMYSDTLGERIGAWEDGTCQACGGIGCKHCDARTTVDGGVDV